MPLIPDKEARQLREHLAERLAGPVTIDLFTRRDAPLVVPARPECPLCGETQRLLEELSALSDKITLDVHDVEAEEPVAAATGAVEVPAIVLRGGARGKVRFLGIPSGYEFATLLEGLIDVSRGTSGLAEPTREALQGLAADVHIRVFVTPSCPFCPRAARVAHHMAVESDRVTADVIEATEFPEMVERYQVQGVPKVVINDRVELLGAQPEARFLAAVLDAARSGAPAGLVVAAASA